MSRRTIRRGSRSWPRWLCGLLGGHLCYFSNYGDYFECERCGTTIDGVPR